MLNIGMIILSICSIIGLVWLTKFAFDTERPLKDFEKIGIESNYICVKDMDDTKLNFAKVTVVILWIQIALVVFTTIWRMSVRV